MLSRREADPGGEVPPLGKGLHRWREGGDRRCGHCPHSRDRRQPPRRIVGGHAPAQLGIKARDLLGQPGDLVEQKACQVADRCRQHAITTVDDGCKAADMRGAGGRDDALLG